MDTQNNENLTQPSEETENESVPTEEQEMDGQLSLVQVKLAQSDKLLKEAVVITLFISIVNIILGAVVNFMPASVLADTPFVGYDGTLLAIYGIIYMGMALGIHKRSRACAIIAMVIFALDVILTVVNMIMLLADGGGLQLAGYAMKVVIFIGLLAGIRGCFQYHSLLKTYQFLPDNRPMELIRRSVRTIKPVPLLLCSIVAAVGIAATVYGSVQTYQALTAGSNFDQWVDYSTADGTVSLKMPADPVEYTEPFDDGDGFSYVFESAQSDVNKCSTMLLTYRGILTQDMDLQEGDLQNIEENMLNELMQSLGGTTAKTTSVTMDGIDCIEAFFEINGEFPGKIRVFATETDIYLALIAMNSASDSESELISQFFEHITVNSTKLA